MPKFANVVLIKNETHNEGAWKWDVVNHCHNVIPSINPQHLHAFIVKIVDKKVPAVMDTHKCLIYYLLECLSNEEGSLGTTLLFELLKLIIIFFIIFYKILNLKQLQTL